MIAVAKDANHRSKSIVFAVATAQEKQACRAVIEARSGPGFERPVFLQTGSGPLNLEELVDQVAGLHASALISIGTAGGLAPGITPGSLLIPKRIRAPNGRILQADSRWQADVSAAMNRGLRVNAGDLLSVSELVRGAAEKHVLYSDTQAVGVDMESSQLAQAAERIGIRFLALRAVMDAWDDAIPGAARAAISASGDTSILSLLVYLLRHPGDFGGMVRTARRFRCAARSLQIACQSGGEALLRSR
jgi:hypothetical protein